MAWGCVRRSKERLHSPPSSSGRAVGPQRPVGPVRTGREVGTAGVALLPEPLPWGTCSVWRRGVPRCGRSRVGFRVSGRKWTFFPPILLFPIVGSLEAEIRTNPNSITNAKFWSWQVETGTQKDPEVGVEEGQGSRGGTGYLCLCNKLTKAELLQVRNPGVAEPGAPRWRPFIYYLSFLGSGIQVWLSQVPPGWRPFMAGRGTTAIGQGRPRSWRLNWWRTQFWAHSRLLTGVSSSQVVGGSPPLRHKAFQQGN